MKDWFTQKEGWEIRTVPKCYNLMDTTWEIYPAFSPCLLFWTFIVHNPSLHFTENGSSFMFLDFFLNSSILPVSSVIFRVSFAFTHLFLIMHANFCRYPRCYILMNCRIFFIFKVFIQLIFFSAYNESGKDIKIFSKRKWVLFIVWVWP